MAIQTNPGATVRNSATSGVIVNGKKTTIIKKKRQALIIKRNCLKCNKNSRDICCLKSEKSVIKANTPDNCLFPGVNSGASLKQPNRR